MLRMVQGVGAGHGTGRQPERPRGERADHPCLLRRDGKRRVEAVAMRRLESVPAVVARIAGEEDELDPRLTEPPKARLEQKSAYALALSLGGGRWDRGPGRERAWVRPRLRRRCDRPQVRPQDQMLTPRRLAQSAQLSSTGLRAARGARRMTCALCEPIVACWVVRSPGTQEFVYGEIDVRGDLAQQRGRVSRPAWKGTVVERPSGWRNCLCEPR